MIKIFNTLVLFLVSLNIYSIEVLEVEILDSYHLKKEYWGKETDMCEIKDCLTEKDIWKTKPIGL